MNISQKPRKAKDQRDEGYMLSEAKFRQLYAKHKLNYANQHKSSIESQIESIKTDGFKGGSGTINVTPISDVTRFKGVSNYEYFL